MGEEKRRVLVEARPGVVTFDGACGWWFVDGKLTPMTEKDDRALLTAAERDNGEG